MRIKVEVENLVTGVQHGGTFQNETINGVTESDVIVREKVDKWKAQQEEKTTRGCGWGWCARIIKKDDYKIEYAPTLIEEFDDVDPMTGETITYCRLDKEYTYNEYNLTSEQQAELAEKEADAVTCEQIKQAVSIIDGWTQLSDININFLKKFFKYLIKKTL